MKYIFTILTISLAICSKAQIGYFGEVYQHLTTSANTSSYITNCSFTNSNNANLHLLATHNWSLGSGQYVTDNFSTWYDGSTWSLYHDNFNNMVLDAGFNIIALDSTNGKIITHKSNPSNIFFNETIIDNTFINNNDSMRLFVIHDYTSSNAMYNANHLGVYYSAGTWSIFNQNTAVGVDSNNEFTLFAVPATNPNAFVHTATVTNTSGHITTIDNPLTNNNPNAKVFITQLWDGIYNNNAVGVYYANGKWKIFNENTSNMPIGAKFNVMVAAPKTPNSINKIDKSNIFSIYPNPCLNALNIRNESSMKFSKIIIRNNLMQVCYEAPYANFIDISNFTQGCYFVEIVCENGSHYIQKFQKQ